MISISILQASSEAPLLQPNMGSAKSKQEHARLDLLIEKMEDKCKKAAAALEANRKYNVAFRIYHTELSV